MDNLPNEMHLADAWLGAASGHWSNRLLSGEQPHSVGSTSKEPNGGVVGALNQHDEDELHEGRLFHEKQGSQTLSGASSKQSRVRRFMPFSYSQRSCVGQNLANVMMLTFIASICANCTVALDPKMGGLEGLRKCAVVGLTLQPKDGRLLQCTPRSSHAAHCPTSDQFPKKGTSRTLARCSSSQEPGDPDDPRVCRMRWAQVAPVIWQGVR
ncbi:hypothetical protein WJX84_006385 [Apatococcus fuscideae]|uniref:Cytochrome P450 n=1 Tax=Apatococcus fuscideae TaxID=2026836 RepID=A0AAW1TCN6_9CHLO